MRPVEAAKIVAWLIAAYPSAQVSEATSRVYESELADLDARLVDSAVRRLTRSSKFLPTIAEIRTAAAALQHGPVRAGGEAWGDVREEIRRVGYMGKPRFDDPLVAEIVARWGWRQLCCEGNDVADRARFIDLYDRRAAEARTDVASGIPLPAPEHRPALRSSSAQAAAGLSPLASALPLQGGSAAALESGAQKLGGRHVG